MPKYYDFKVYGYYLYFTSHCIIECMHVHASDSKLTEAGSAKFFVKSNGDSVLQNRGVLNFLALMISDPHGDPQDEISQWKQRKKRRKRSPLGSAERAKNGLKSAFGRS